MTTLIQAKEAIQDNLQRYVSASDNPALYNLNVAMEGIVDALVRLQRDADRIEKIERSVNQIATRRR